MRKLRLKCNFSFNKWTSQTGISLLAPYLLSLLRDHIAQMHANQLLPHRHSHRSTFSNHPLSLPGPETFPGIPTQSWFRCGTKNSLPENPWLLSNHNSDLREARWCFVASTLRQAAGVLGQAGPASSEPATFSTFMYNIPSSPSGVTTPCCGGGVHEIREL